ncbi:nucleotidyltransferase family protein [Rheinheimera soli]|uniref:nucleotidyltransferase family protein n=1 Tax=Rheinheimera soli TaxID=443616 RepID=UPI001E3BC760|nr:hypothetical protein [Rheinheimera soli]
MKPPDALAKHREEILNIIAAHHVRNVRGFGSVLQGTDTEQGDLDLLVDPCRVMAIWAEAR